MLKNLDSYGEYWNFRHNDWAQLSHKAEEPRFVWRILKQLRIILKHTYIRGWRTSIRMENTETHNQGSWINLFGEAEEPRFVWRILKHPRYIRNVVFLNGWRTSIRMENTETVANCRRIAFKYRLKNLDSYGEYWNNQIAIGGSDGNDSWRTSIRDS